MDRALRLEVAEVHREELRQILRQADDLDLVHHVADDVGRQLDRRRRLRVDVVQRHLHVDLLVRGDALEVDVQYLLLERVVLHVAQQHALGARAVDLEVEDRRMERFLAQRVEEIVVVELDVDRRGAAAVDDARDLAGATQAAARTRTLRRPRGGCDFHELLQ